MPYKVEEYLGGRWYFIRSFYTRADAEGFASQVGGNWRIRYEAEDVCEEEYLVD